MRFLDAVDESIEALSRFWAVKGFEDILIFYIIQSEVLRVVRALQGVGISRKFSNGRKMMKGLTDKVLPATALTIAPAPSPPSRSRWKNYTYGLASAIRSASTTALIAPWPTTEPEIRNPSNLIHHFPKRSQRMILEDSLLCRNGAEYASLLFVVASHVVRTTPTHRVTAESAFFRNL